MPVVRTLKGGIREDEDVGQLIRFSRSRVEAEVHFARAGLGVSRPSVEVTA